MFEDDCNKERNLNKKLILLSNILKTILYDQVNQISLSFKLNLKYI